MRFLEVGFYSLLLSFVILFFTVGPISLIGVAFVVASFFMVKKVSRLQMRLRQREDAVSGRRVELIEDMVKGMRTLKVYAWELLFCDQVDRLREE